MKTPSCRALSWALVVFGLALGALTARSVAYLIHPEHGMTGIAPGTYIIRRQRERSAEALREANRLIAD